jgi:hypothetical protein
MSTDRYSRFVLTVIAGSLLAIALRPFADPPRTFAGAASSNVYIEPGVFSLRAPDGSKDLLGRVIVDLQTGQIWGFPTTSRSPYPVSVHGPEPAISEPYLLGKFDFQRMQK